MTIFQRWWTVLSVLGPTAPPAKGAKAETGPKSLEPSERGMFDDPEGEEPAGDEAEAEGDETRSQADDAGAEPDGNEPEGDEPEGDAPEGDEPEGEEPRAERTEEDDPDADEPEAEDDDEDEDDTALSLRASYETRLEADAKANPDQRPRLKSVGAIALRAEARKRFDEIRSRQVGENEDAGKHDAEAMAEVALDIALQVVGAYHDDVAAPTGDRVEKGLRNVQVGRTLNEFRRKMGDRLPEKVEQRMAAIYLELAGKYGWRRADSVPLKALFRMAGGSFKKPAAEKPAGEPKGDDKANRQKRAALGAAAAGPRALGRTRPEGGERRKEDRALREFAEDNRARAPFFTLG